MKKDTRTTIIKFDFWSIARIFAIILGLLFLYLIRDIILIIFTAAILATIITPLVNFMQKKKIARWLGAAIVYVFIILIIALLGVAIVPKIINQTHNLISKLPETMNSLMGVFSLDSGVELSQVLGDWFQGPSNLTKSFFSVLGSVTGQFFTAFMIFVISFYLTIEKKTLSSVIEKFIPERYKGFLDRFLDSIQKEIGAWGRGMIVLVLAVSIMVYVGLSILGVKYALALAFLAGVTEFIPYIGAYIGAVPALIIALTQSPSLALFVAILYFVIQQIQGSLISPYIMHRAVGLDPLTIIIVLLIGGKVAGPLGMILAVPFATIISILIKDYRIYKRKSAEKEAQEEVKI